MRFRPNGREYTKKFSHDDTKSCRIESACACTGILFFLPLVSAPGSKFGRYWANQGLLILFVEILALIAWLLSSWLLGLLSLIPLIGILFAIAKVLVAVTICLVVAYFIFLPMSFAARGRARDTAYIGFMRFIK